MMSAILEWLQKQQENTLNQRSPESLAHQEFLDKRRSEHEDKQKNFTAGSQYSSLVGGQHAGGSGGPDVGPNAGHYSDSIMGMLELLKDAEKSSMGAYRSDDEREASSSQASRLRNLLGNRITDPGSLVRNAGGSSMGGGGGSRARSGINSSVLGQMEWAKNKAREEQAYQLMRKKQLMDMAMTEDQLKAQRSDTRRKPSMDAFKKELILEMLRGRS